MMGRPQDVRSKILARRDQLSDLERQEKSSRIATALLSSAGVESNDSIFIYVSFRSEVETLSIIHTLLNLGKKVSVPLTRVAEKRLDLVVIEDPDSQLVPGYCNIPEPRLELADSRAIPPEEIDLIVLPGSVFDERGGRYGYGGGYYDRLLERVPAAARYALAFDLQVVERLDLQPHDQLLDMVITEKRTIVPPRRPPHHSS